jgi:uncharacterized protein involved in exopolysaccharide biosynthesis
VGSYAAVPEDSIGPRKLSNIALAGTLGLILGIFVAFALHWLRGDEKKAETA